MDWKRETVENVKSLVLLWLKCRLYNKKKIRLPVDFPKELDVEDEFVISSRKDAIIIWHIQPSFFTADTRLLD